MVLCHVIVDSVHSWALMGFAVLVISVLVKESAGNHIQ